MKKATEFVHFNGPCLFLTCFEQGPHDHPICPDCGAVRWGNAYCETCRSHWAEELDNFKQVIEKGAESK